VTDRLDIPIHGPYHHPLGPDPIPGGFAVREIKIFEDINTVVVGDNAYIFEVPEDLHESMLVKAEAYVTTPSSSGSVQVQLRRLDDGFANAPDMLSTKITIEANDYNSKTAMASLQPVVDFAQAGLDWGDHIAIDVDSAGVGAKGLGVIVVCAPLHLASIALQGLQGTPGGTTFEGNWATSTQYQPGDVVQSGGTSYVAIAAHTAGASTQPGVGASWQTVWAILAIGHQYSAVEMVVAGFALPISSGLMGFEPIRFPCTIIEATLLADAVGSCVVDIWKDTYGNFPPTDADSITSSSPPTLVSAIKSTDTALAGWTTALADGDVLAFNIDSISGSIRRLTLGLKVQRS
jgi:hypothetical protein